MTEDIKEMLKMYKRDLEAFINKIIDELEDDLTADEIFTFNNFTKTETSDITKYDHSDISIVFDKQHKVVYVRDTVSRNKVELSMDEIVAMYLKCREYDWIDK